MHGETSPEDFAREQDALHAQQSPVVAQATGVLIAGGCLPADAAAREVLLVAGEHEVDLEELCRAVVATAAGESVENPLLRKVIWEEWRDVVPNS